MDQSGILLLQALDGGAQALQLLDLNLGLLLVDINYLQFLSVLLSTVVANLSNEKKCLDINT